MHCTLLIPHLFWREAVRSDIGAALDLPALGRILARASRERFAAVPLEAWLCQAFEVERQQDWPVAPLTLMIDGGLPSDAYWLRADPVHVRAERDELRLADAAIVEPRRDESDRLVAALNAHFGQDGLQFLALHPARWYIRVTPAPGLTTHTLSEAAGADVAPLLPAGTDRLAWHRIVNEIQMLLHEHPVNAEREARGALPINSVWLWGGGTQPAVPGRHFDVVWSGDPLAQALAAAADIEVKPAPGGAQELLTGAGRQGAHLVILDRLKAPARYGDLMTWLDRASRLEQEWFAPLEKAVSAGSLEQLTVVAPGRFACERFEFGRTARWRFWRRPRPLSAYSASHT